MIKFDKNSEFPITKAWQKGQLAVKEGKMDEARDWFDSGIAMVATYSMENNEFVATIAIPEPNTPNTCLLYTSPSPRDRQKSRMPSSA